MGWTGPSLTLRWGEYSKPDPADEAVVVTATVAAKTAGLITQRMALEKLQRIYGIEDVNAAIVTLEEEATKRRDDAVAHAGNMAKTAGPQPPGPQPGQPKEPDE
jgi:hypothetical protein